MHVRGGDAYKPKGTTHVIRNSPGVVCPDDITLEQALTVSCNTAFSRYGVEKLGASELSRAAKQFGFEEPLTFARDRDNVLGIATSRTGDLSDDDAPVLAQSCIGQSSVRMTPLQGAMIAAAVANDGFMMEPWLVATIRDESGGVLYQAEPNRMAAPIKKSTADSLKILMADTVISGTCRKAFRPLRRKKRFIDVAMGAKTGTINDKLDQFKYDWLTAYAIPSNKSEAICVTILAVHGEKLGIRAANLARYVISKYFSPS